MTLTDYLNFNLTVKAIRFCGGLGAIDCDNFNNRYDDPLGHTYFLNSHEGENISGALFDHLWQCLDTGRVPNIDRHTNRNQILSLPF